MSQAVCHFCGGEPDPRFSFGGDPICSRCYAEGLETSPEWVETHRGVVELASEDDRSWFEQHPSESVRVRAEFVGEFPKRKPPNELDALVEAGGTVERLVEVTQVQPGFRIRRPRTFVAFEGMPS